MSISVLAVQMRMMKILKINMYEINKKNVPERKNIFQSFIDAVLKLKSTEITEFSNKTGYPLNKKHICFKSGHNFYEIHRASNQFSAWRTHRCSRCGFEDSFQYDF
jgi:hypothetical protein